MMRFVLALIFGLISVPLAFAAGGDKPLVNHVDLIISKHETTPFPEEMVLLKVRTVLFQTEVAEQEFEQPSLENFSWMQLGSDRSYRTVIDGAPAIVFERLLALYPVKSGKLVIDSFVHHLTLVDSNNIRRKVDLRSPQAYVDVGPWTAPRGGPAKANWLPASSFSVNDKWNPEPDRFTPGTIAHRTVTIEAKGITADRLPAAPQVRAPGAIILGGTVERVTTMTPTGPIARGVYRWDLALTTALPVTIDAIHIPWFDTKSRQMRDAVIPARTLAFVAAAREHTSQNSPSTNRMTLMVAGVGAFILGSIVLFVRSGHAPGVVSIAEHLRLQRELKGLRRSARSRDPGAFRSAIFALSRRDPARWHSCAETPSVESGLAALDEYLFGSRGDTAPNLRAINKSITTAWAASASSRTGHGTDNALSQ